MDLRLRFTFWKGYASRWKVRKGHIRQFRRNNGKTVVLSIWKNDTVDKTMTKCHLNGQISCGKYSSATYTITLNLSSSPGTSAGQKPTSKYDQAQSDHLSTHEQLGHSQKKHQQNLAENLFHVLFHISRNLFHISRNMKGLPEKRKLFGIDMASTVLTLAFLVPTLLLYLWVFGAFPD